MEESAIRNVLILVCGIPGSGKSTLCEQLIEYLKNKQYSCKYIEADAVEKRIISNKLTKTVYYIEHLSAELMEFEKIKPNAGLCKETKANTNNEKLMQNLESNIFDADCWKESREISKELVKQSLTILQSSPKTEYLIFEDVLNLRSQRQDYLNIARRTQNTKQVGFCQIFLNAQLEDCIQRDKLRETSKQVGEYVIIKSLNQFDPVENTTESVYSIIYSSNKTQQKVESLNNFQELVCQLEKICSVNVKPKVQDNNNDNPADKANLMQLIDLNLRNIISKYLKDSIHSISGKSTLEGSGNKSITQKQPCLSGEHLSMMKKLFLILVAPFVHQQQLSVSGVLPSIEQQIQQNFMKQWKKLGFSDEYLKELSNNLIIGFQKEFQEQISQDIHELEGNEDSKVAKEELIEAKAKAICKLFETEFLLKI